MLAGDAAITMGCGGGFMGFLIWVLGLLCVFPLSHIYRLNLVFLCGL